MTSYLGLLLDIPTRTAAGVAAPVNTVAPAIAGNNYPGQTLTATPGTWDGADSVTGQWLRDGVAISGATKKALYKDGERVKITSVVEGLNIAPAEVWAVGTYPFLFLESLDSSTGNAKNQAGGDKTLVVAMLY